ncbi:hypothetical protein [Endozoicomonas acroporae]|uniref:hypothetical protein n=1 Tax=Endozoicomonas acroporae TaxID=1701104 RepID=UPI003D7C05E7
MFQKFGFTGESTFFIKLWKIISKAFYIISATMGSILMALGGAYAGSYNFHTEWVEVSGSLDSLLCILFNPVSSLVSGGALLVFGAIGTYLDQSRQQAEITQLREGSKSFAVIKNALNAAQEELQFQKSKTSELHSELVQSWLIGAYKTLQLNNQERVTIYYEHDEEFYLLARHSKNPHFAKIHRQKFPLNQGVISLAWQNDLHLELGCPSQRLLEGYIQYMHVNYGYAPEKIKALGMKSCRYLAKAIIDADVHIGVIVFESTEETFLESDDQRDDIIRYCDSYQGRISKFVRDGFEFNKEICLKRKGNHKPIIEDELIKELGGAN